MSALAKVLLFTLVVGACTTPGDSAVTTAMDNESEPDQRLTDIEIQGHRGARGLKPENTLPSFETALDLGVSALELDLHFSADGGVVVWHDPVVASDKCRRSENAPDDVPDPDDPATPADSLRIRALTLAQLGWYRCDRNPDPVRFPAQSSEPTAIAGTDFRIVSLSEVFEFVATYAEDPSKTEAQRENARSIEFNVETKRRPGDPTAIGDGFDGTTAGPFEERLLAIIEQHGVEDRTIVQSFDHRSLAAIAASRPGIRLSALTSDGTIDIGAYAELGAVIWSPNAGTLTQRRVDEAHELGLLVIPWTVNDIDEAAQLALLGVDGIITDRPDLMIEP